MSKTPPETSRTPAHGGARKHSLPPRRRQHFQGHSRGGRLPWRQYAAPPGGPSWPHAPNHPRPPIGCRFVQKYPDSSNFISLFPREWPRLAPSRQWPPQGGPRSSGQNNTGPEHLSMPGPAVFAASEFVWLADQAVFSRRRSRRPRAPATRANTEPIPAGSISGTGALKSTVTVSFAPNAPHL